MRIVAFIGLPLASLIIPTAVNATCPGVVAGKSSPTEVESFYVERATNIIQAAVANDVSKLRGLVDPNAAFEVWQGDSSHGRNIGVAGAIEMVRFIKPVGAQSAIPLSGPVWIAASPEIGLKCAWNATLLLRTEQAKKAFEIRFDFVDGQLSRAFGHQAILFETIVR
jgi:hypothetical protein